MRIPSGLGIRVLAMWSLMLAILAFLNLLLLSESVELYSNQFNNQAQLWIIFIISLIFCFTFLLSAYALWQYHNWGRILFLLAIAIWFGFNLVTMTMSNFVSSETNSYDLSELFVDSLQSVVAIMLPLWYLNIPHIKAIFHKKNRA